MARDVDFNVTAQDRTGDALRRAEENFRRANDRITKDSKDRDDKIFASLVKTTGSVLSPKLAGKLTEAFAVAADAGGPLLAGAAVAAAPLLASTLAGAVIGGAGIGGVLGGILLVKDNPQVVAAFDGMSNRLKDRLKSAAQPFVSETISGIDRIEGALDSVDFEGILSSAAKFVDPLAGGVARFISELGDGIEDLVNNADPVIRSISNGVGDLGEAIGEGLSSLSDNADSAAQSLDSVFGAVSTLTKLSFGTVNALIEVDEQLRKVGLNATAGLDLINKLFHTDSGEFAKHTKEAGESSDELRARLEAQAAAAASLGPTMDELAASTRQVQDADRGLYDAATSVGEALDAVKESAKENGKTLSANTEEGRANRQAFSRLAGALNESYDSFVKVNGAGAAASEVASKNYDSFVHAAEGAGLSARKARDLASALGLIPPKRNVDVLANTHDAEARVKALQDRLNALHSKTITITVARRVTGSSASDSALASALGKQGAFAGGGSGYWAPSGPGSVARVGGPAPVDVQNTVLVNLDGAPFYAATATAVRSDRKRTEFRNRVGTR